MEVIKLWIDRYDKARGSTWKMNNKVKDNVIQDVVYCLVENWKNGSEPVRSSSRIFSIVKTLVAICFRRRFSLHAIQ